MNLGAIRERLQKTAALMRVGEMGERLAGRDLSVLLARADEVMADTYTFSKTWDMERCRVPFTLPSGAYDWNVVNNDDEEWCFMLNRMDYLEDLALASLVTGDEKQPSSSAPGWTRTPRSCPSSPRARSTPASASALWYACSQRSTRWAC